MRYRVDFEEYDEERGLADEPLEALGQVDLLLREAGHESTESDADFRVVVSNDPTRPIDLDDLPEVVIYLDDWSTIESTGWTVGERGTRIVLRDQQWPTRLNAHLQGFMTVLNDWVGHPPRNPVDEGPALLEAITHDEHAAIERILGILGEAQQAGTLTPWQEQQIILMADLIRAARDEAVPEHDERWKVVGVVGGALRYLARELPEDVVKWGAAGLVLSNIDWHNLAQALPGG